MKKVSFFKKFLLAMRIVAVAGEELVKIVSDNKITIIEGVSLIKVICKELGVDFEYTGYDLSTNRFKAEGDK